MRHRRAPFRLLSLSIVLLAVLLLTGAASAAPLDSMMDRWTRLDPLTFLDQLLPSLTASWKSESGKSSDPEGTSVAPNEEPTLAQQEDGGTTSEAGVEIDPNG